MPSHSLFLKEKQKTNFMKQQQNQKNQRFFVLPPETFFKHYFTIFSFSARFSTEKKSKVVFQKHVLYSFK